MREILVTKNFKDFELKSSETPVFLIKQKGYICRQSKKTAPNNSAIQPLVSLYAERIWQVTN